MDKERGWMVIDRINCSIGDPVTDSRMKKKKVKISQT